MIKNYTDFAPPERLSKEEILKQHNKLLKDTFFSRNLFDKIPIMILILNRFRQIIFVNEYFKKITSTTNVEDVLGYRPGEIFNCKYSDINPAGCGTSKFCRYCGAVNAILASLKGTKDIRECDILLKDNNALNLLVSADTLQLDSEDFIVFTIQDIKEKKEMNFLEKTFLGTLKESIVEIKIASNMLQSEFSENELLNEIARISEKILYELDLQKLILNAESYNLEINFNEINTFEILNEVLEKFNFQENIVTIEPDSANINFISDYFIIFVVLQQIIKNGIDVREENENIFVSVKKDNGKITFNVKNRRFIPENVQLVIFKRSYSEFVPGHGFGAYIAKLLCERYLKGSVDFTSDREKGTIFKITIPENLEKELSLK